MPLLQQINNENLIYARCKDKTNESGTLKNFLYVKVYTKCKMKLMFICIPSLFCYFSNYEYNQKTKTWATSGKFNTFTQFMKVWEPMA